MGTTLAVISAENNTPTNFTNRCFWSLSSWLLPLPTPRNSPSSTKSPSPSSDLLSFLTRPANTPTATRPEMVSPSRKGEQKLIGDKPEEVGSVSRGSYSYELEGVTYTVNWVADENGFQPTGAHLPVAPAMPEHVKLLADLKAAGQL